jgi:hypothetical protein
MWSEEHLRAFAEAMGKKMPDDKKPNDLSKETICLMTASLLEREGNVEDAMKKAAAIWRFYDEFVKAEDDV